MSVFENRTDAGQQLARALDHYADRADVLVLGLPRGGVPVAEQVADALDAELDVLIVRKLGYPGQEELAAGAIASGGIRVLNENIWLPEDVLGEITERELRELRRREQAYRGDRPYPSLEGRCIILIDDGLATGATMRAAVAAVRQRRPARVVVAVPVAPQETVRKLREEADEVICVETPASFFGIGQFYLDFSQTTDAVVRDILLRAWERGRQKSNSHA